MEICFPRGRKVILLLTREEWGIAWTLVAGKVPGDNIHGIINPLRKTPVLQLKISARRESLFLRRLVIMYFHACRFIGEAFHICPSHMLLMALNTKHIRVRTSSVTSSPSMLEASNCVNYMNEMFSINVQRPRSRGQRRQASD